MQSNENDVLQKNDGNKFSGSWIPAGLLSAELSDSEKLLLSLIYNLSGNGCQASNDYFARRLGWSYRKTERTVTALKTAGWINISGGQSTYRRIYLTSKTSETVELWADVCPLDFHKNVEVKPEEEPVNFHKNVEVTSTKMWNHSDKNVEVTSTNLWNIYKSDNKEIEKVIEKSPRLVSEIPDAEVIETEIAFSLTPPASAQPKEKKKSGKTVGPPQFEHCWKLFEGYGSKKKALEYWSRLSQADRDAIEAKIPDYVASTPGCQYRKMFEGWINPENELWKRPIVRRKSEEKFSIQARNENIKRDLEAIEKNPEIIHVSGFDRDQALLKKLFNY